MTEIDFVMSSVEALKGSSGQFSGMRSSFLLVFHDAFLAQSVKSRYYKARGREFDPTADQTYRLTLLTTHLPFASEV